MSTPGQPPRGDHGWGDPAFDPRSPEWRDPDAQPWWGGGTRPPEGFPPSPMYAGPPRDRRRGPLIALGVAVVLILIVGVSLALRGGSRHQALIVGPDPLASSEPFPGGGPIADPPSLDPILPSAPASDPPASEPPDTGSSSTDPQPSQSASSGDPVGTAKAYYGDLAENRAGPAWNLLCDAREQAQPLADYKAAYAQDVATGTGIKTFTTSGAAQISGTTAAVPGTIVLDDKEVVPITVLLLEQDSGWRVCSSDLGGVLPNPGTGSGSGDGGVTT